MFLTGAGIEFSELTDLDAAVLAGIRAFERTCCRHFLAGKDIDNSDLGTAGEETRYFDTPLPPTGILDLGRYGDLTTFTSMVYQPLGSSPQALTLNTDFWLLEENAPSLGAPWMAVQFRWGQWPVFWASTWDSAWRTGIRALQVSGKWGYGLTIPDDAWRAMLLSSVFGISAELQQIISGGMESWRASDGTSESYGAAPYQLAETQRKTWAAQIEQVACNYKRVTF
jgi:hypothetical protein